jgi:hypothetical protein
MDVDLVEFQNISKANVLRIVPVLVNGTLLKLADCFSHDP